MNKSLESIDLVSFSDSKIFLAFYISSKIDWQCEMIRILIKILFIDKIGSGSTISLIVFDPKVEQHLIP